METDHLTIGEFMNHPARSEKAPHIYRNIAMDSARWDKFSPRDGDIIICTHPKCGTTWMQMICALLIFQKTDLGRPLSDFSPWLDMLIAPVDDVIALFEAQTHRRFIKTHTPFDGLPYYKNVTYFCVGRDPRDVFMSMDNQVGNANPEFMMKLAKNMKPGDKLPSPQVTDLRERFRTWITASLTPETCDNPMAMPAPPYMKSFWDYRHLPQIHFVHYSDLQRDLGGEMRRIAKILDIHVAENLWPGLIAAAQFESMKQNSAMLAPDAKTGIWKDTDRFFNKGETGQWRDTLGPDELALYEKTMHERLEPELARWIESGRGVS